MSWTDREQQVWNEITDWEQEKFSETGTDFSRIYQKGFNSWFSLLEEQWTKGLLTRLDDILFHLQAVIQQGRFDEKARNYLLTQARVFRSDIYSIEDIKKLTIDQLRFIAKKNLAKQRLTALAQGGLTGVGGLVFTVSDLPLMLSINLRTVQLMALTYGYDIRKPYEMMLALKLFHAISLPKPLQGDAWERVFLEVDTVNEDWFFYEGEEDITSQAWIQRPLNHIGKLFLLSFARKKVVQGIPLFGIVAGASINYQFAQHVAETAHTFYQKRRLLEKMEEGD